MLDIFDIARRTFGAYLETRVGVSGGCCIEWGKVLFQEKVRFPLRHALGVGEDECVVVL